MIIENDVVISHGRWCLERMMPPERAMSKESAAIHAANAARVQGTIDARREHLHGHPQDFVQSL